ncbi:MAG: TOBE domain-containing protein, partial [Planctomycetaceae bacterium]
QTPFVAEFIGTTNFLKGEVSRVTDHSIKVSLHGSEISAARAGGFRPGDKVLIVLRPEMIRFAEERDKGALPGKLREVFFLGSLARYVVEMETGDRIQVDEPNPKRFRSPGSLVFLVVDEEALHLQKRQ